MRLVFSFFCVFLILSLTACGSKSDEQSSSESSSESESNRVLVELTGNDQMQFNLKTIEVPAGSTVRLNLKHIGQMGIDIMGHNFVLLKQGVDLPAFATKAINAKDFEYIPQDEKANIIAYTGLIGGGQSTSVEFTAPAAGSYKFLCTFPGHFAVMQGDFIVK